MVDFPCEFGSRTREVPGWILPFTLYKRLKLNRVLEEKGNNANFPKKKRELFYDIMKRISTGDIKDKKESK